MTASAIWGTTLSNAIPLCFPTLLTTSISVGSDCLQSCSRMSSFMLCTSSHLNDLALIETFQLSHTWYFWVLLRHLIPFLQLCFFLVIVCRVDYPTRLHSPPLKLHSSNFLLAWWTASSLLTSDARRLRKAHPTRKLSKCLLWRSDCVDV